jgi:hypothetical protein
MTDEMTIKASRERSPSFPFIPLGVAIQRLETFERYFGRHPTPANKVGLGWGMKEQSSQADQTLAALRSFGLVVYTGSGSARMVTISDEGRTYLRAQQESVKESCLKQAALRPRVIRKYWAQWGADRPPNPVALDTLTLQDGFSDNGAQAFLKVYDDTVAFAKLTTGDKIPGEKGSEEDNGDLPPPPSPPPAGGQGNRTTVMAGERELTTGLLGKDTSFRLIVNGQIGVKEIERLIKKLELDKEILADQDNGTEEPDYMK